MTHHMLIQDFYISLSASEQWGTANITTATLTPVLDHNIYFGKNDVALPIAFPNYILHAESTPNCNYAYSANSTILAATTSTVNISATRDNGGGLLVWFIAIGY